MQPQTDDLLSFEQPPQEDLLSFESQEDNAIVPHQQDNAIVPHEPQATKTQPSLYQTAFKVDYLGKRNKKSKQQVTWTFVKDNENHIVMLTWSTKTGKVLVHLDGEQVDQSQIKGYSIIHRKIELDDFGKIEIIATRTIPNKAAKDFLCYECIINGKAFSTLPIQQENRLLMETNEDGSGDQVLFGDDSAASDDDAEQELNEDYATPYYVEDIESVVDIVYPSGIPPYTPDT
jgi:hypothetical protein